MTDSKSIGIARNIIVGILIVLAFLFAISITGTNPLDFWKSLGSQIILLVISFLIYISPYKRSLLGINTKTFGASVMLGIIIGIVYVFIVSLIPGLAIAVPLLPNAVSDSLRFFVVTIVAPIVETFFFLGALLGYLRSFNPSMKRIHIAIFIQAIVFSLFHLGVWILGLYDLPGIREGFLGLSSNLSTFISAFIFGEVMGYLVYLKRIYSLVIAWVVHTIINLSAYLRFAVTFSIFGN